MNHDIPTHELITVKKAIKELDRDVFMSKDVANYCEFSSQQVGYRLGVLENNNIVEKVNSGTPHRWRILK